MADIAEGVDSVGSLGEGDVRKRELAELSRIVDVDVVEDSEATADSLGETATAVAVETTSRAIDDAEEHFFVVSGRVRGACGFCTAIGIIGVLNARIIIVISQVDGLRAGSGHVGGGSALMLSGLVVDSLDVDVFL